MSRMQRITSPAELDEALHAPVALLYKHSTTCPISAMTMHELSQVEQRAPDLPIYLLDVHNQRRLAREIAQSLDVRHESPQVILVRDGDAVWNASHFRITADAVLQQL